MYSDIPNGTPNGDPPYEFTFGTDKCGNFDSEGDCYNREHSFPASWFNDATPMYTDLFHLYPTDGYVNNRRGNYPFGTVSPPTWTSMNGSKVGSCSFTGYSGTVFEPRDDFKGDFARSYLYMVTRYENVVAGWHSNNNNAEAVLQNNSYPAFETWFVNLLLTWCAADPVSAKEIARNEAVYAIQNNRNPYIDHPEFANAIWAPETVKEEPSNFPTIFTATTEAPSYTTITLTWADATGAVIPDGYLIRGSTTGFSAITAPVDGIPVDDGGLDKNVTPGVQALTFSGLTINTTFYFKVFPYTNPGALINFKTAGTVPQAYVITSPPIPEVFDVSGSGSYCAGEPGLTVTLSGSQTGVNYQLKKNDINEEGLAPGTGSSIYWPGMRAGTYTVGATNGYYSVSMNGSAIITETIPLPVSVSIIRDTNDVCEETTVTFTAVPVNGGMSPGYQWFVNSENTGTNDSVFSYIPVNGDLVNCYLTSDAPCVSGNPATSDTLTITVNPLPIEAGAIMGPDTVHRDQTEVFFTIPAITNATGYLWTLPSGASITGGENTNTIEVNFSDTASSGIINVHGTNLCGNGVSSPDFEITVNLAIPEQLQVEGIVTEGRLKCYNATQIITVAGNGKTFIVQEGGIARLIAGQNIIFLPGTTVEEGGYLHSYITTTDTYCGDMPPALVGASTKALDIPVIKSNSPFSVYPNPNQGTFTLVMSDAGLTSTVYAELYKMTGERILQQTLTGETRHQFDLPGQPSGIYILRLSNSDRTEIIKIIKQ